MCQDIEFNAAREPKKLSILPGDHFDAYVGPGFKMANEAARDWFVDQPASKED